MGGGNGAKAATKRERNAAKNKKAKRSQMASNQSAMNIICNICRATFMCTMKEASLRQHAESKHPKHQLTDCFPHLAKSN
ncbi:hypothetical protein BWQ96_02628 [Gracilariopsis chorda]|uniref:At2g23090-like zinc-binding domain-containing protein n=1 Tax=Gracilariopsis chorda TaxID=448386 RepID=A0A2V3IZX6_9FLOR|nr:hypothetical protein BWQ96_02628 [Gracilariopsis chorda]|eukprot:PXF47649.1 hypothetical protein BWQ96_02628 [Gracilariopsis chorda]